MAMGVQAGALVKQECKGGILCGRGGSTLRGPAVAGLCDDGGRVFAQRLAELFCLEIK
jgi:hypothetical protein